MAAQTVLAVDAMGGDNAPGCVIEGVKMYLEAHAQSCVRLFGPAQTLEPLLGSFGALRPRVSVCDAPEVIGTEDEPMLAVRRKQNSSLVLGLKDVKAGASHAFVSAGSTGALFLGGMVVLRLLEGVSRPALAPVLPGLNGSFLLIDSGANADCQPGYLNQFGLMGSVYMNRVEGVKKPKVGLINIGVESEKGNKLYKEAHALMSAQKQYAFAGNLEARDIPNGDVQVAVCDGFTGNVVLKYTEGFAKFMLKTIKGEMMSSLRGKIGGLLLKGSFANIKKRLSSDEYGGAPLLGVDGAVVKAHGSSGGYAFFKALEQAERMVTSGMTDTLRQGLREINNNTEV